MDEQCTGKISFKEFKKSFFIIKSIMKLLLQISKKYLIYNIILSILIGIIPIINILITQKLMNLIQVGKKSINSLVFIFILYIAFGILGNLIGHLQGYISDITQGYFSYKVNVKVMEKASKLKLKDYEDSEVYDMVKRADTESGIRPYLVFSSLLSLITALVTLISSLGILIKWKWWTIISFFIIPIFTGKYFVKIGKNEQKVYIMKTENERKSWYISFLLTKDQTIKELKINNLSNYLVKMFENLKSSLFEENKKLSKKRGIFKFLFDCISFIISNMIILIAIIESFFGKILIGNLMSIIKATSIVDSNLKGFTTTIFSLYEDSLYAQHLINFLNMNTYKNNVKQIEYIKLDKIETISLKNISYRYDKSNLYSLKNINLEIKKGDKIIIVGENGSGKSTLVKILTGLYDDYEGEICINGININKFDLDSVREKLAVVFQDYVEYQTSVRENVAFGSIDKLNDDEHIISATRKSGALDFIDKLNNKLDSQVGSWFEGGVQLSGGQWQKLAISRAFIKEADMYVLDEPSAALDPLSEYNLFENILKLTENNIAIFITHRFTNTKFSNKIIVLDKGELIQEGTHDELINTEGKYKTLFELQQYDNENTQLSC